LLFLPFIDQYASLVARTSSDLPRQIANAHTIFNLAVSALLFPFVDQIATLSGWLTPGARLPEKEKVTAFIDEMQYSVPAVALTESARELARVAEITAQMLKDSCQALIDLDLSKTQRVIVQEDRLVDPICKELTNFINN
jgi:phosphate:Na+ symporter